ncbi:hypothetical protein KAR91_54020 [Candidatus Pacearchaeota archaeon]|nr:hypothetical protein [Candidatus Pacearchaeota archaeon]
MNNVLRKHDHGCDACYHAGVCNHDFKSCPLEAGALKKKGCGTCHIGTICNYRNRKDCPCRRCLINSCFWQPCETYADFYKFCDSQMVVA